MEQGSSSRLLKALPLKLQQTAFENAYLKAQEGMRQVVILLMPICYYCMLSLFIYFTKVGLRQLYPIIYNIKLD